MRVGGDEIERVEVELFATDGDASSPFAGPTAVPPPSPRRPSDADANRSVGVAPAILAVVAIVVAGAWFLRRSDDVRPPIESVPAVPVGVVASTEAPVLVPMAPVTPALGDTEPMLEEIVGVSAVLADQQLELVAYGNGRQLIRLDLSTGVLRTQVVQRHAFGRARLLAGTDWLLLPTPDHDLPSLVIDADGVVDQVDFGSDRRVLGVTDFDRVWLTGTDVADGARVVESATIGGDVIGRLELPGSPSGFDPRGGFVVEGPEGASQVAVEASAVITLGTLLALGADTTVSLECDTAECVVAVVDRATGARRSIEPRRSDGAEPPELAIVGPSSVAPGGRHAMVVVLNPTDGSTAQSMLGTVDLTSGEVAEVGRAQNIDQSVWSPDGRFLIFNGGGRLRAYDVTTGGEIVISDRLVAIDAFAVRPPLPDDGF